MKGLRKYLTPFAPDQSGAVSMCYALGGMVVIVDAGGCAGNICGFDEPRWQPDYLTGDRLETGETAAKDVPRVGAVFSAALRDMDAILGRDEFLIRKVEDSAKKIDVNFIALIGTPVPAVIGTDLKALSRMAERKTGLPCIGISTDGMHLYDKGIEETLLELIRTFADREGKIREDTCGVLGLNPLDLFDPGWMEAIRSSLMEKGWKRVLLHAMDGGLDTVKNASAACKNYVVSPAGLPAARYLEKEFGIPYEVSFPADPLILLDEDPFSKKDPESLLPDPDCAREKFKSIEMAASDCGDVMDYKKILVVHQQVLANAIRNRLRERGVKAEIRTATWFDFKRELSEEGDVKLSEEDDFTALSGQQDWELIIADPALRPMASAFRGRWIDAYHFAVSGQAAIRANIEKRSAGNV